MNYSIIAVLNFIFSIDQISSSKSYGLANDSEISFAMTMRQTKRFCFEEEKEGVRADISPNVGYNIHHYYRSHLYLNERDLNRAKADESNIKITFTLMNFDLSVTESVLSIVL